MRKEGQDFWPCFFSLQLSASDDESVNIPPECKISCFLAAIQFHRMWKWASKKSYSIIVSAPCWHETVPYSPFSPALLISKWLEQGGFHHFPRGTFWWFNSPRCYDGFHFPFAQFSFASLYPCFPSCAPLAVCPPTHPDIYRVSSASHPSKEFCPLNLDSESQNNSGAPLTALLGFLNNYVVCCQPAPEQFEQN